MEETQKPILPEKRYHIPFEMFKAAFTAFQRRYVYPKNYAIIAVLLLACVIYTISILQSSVTEQPLYGFVILCCLIMCAFQWYNPRKIRRNLLEAVKEIGEDTYILRIFPEYLEIGTLIPEEELQNEETAEADALFDDQPEEQMSGTRIFYSKLLKVTEYQDFFMVYQKKSMFYVIPKSAFSEEELAQLRAHFAGVLGKGFSSR